jgi:hypothetical protein
MTQVSRREKCVLMLGFSLRKGAACAGVAVEPRRASGGRRRRLWGAGAPKSPYEQGVFSETPGIIEIRKARKVGE